MRRFASAARGCAAALALAAIALGGCGGDDANPDEVPPRATVPPTKPEFLREADAICRSSEARIEAAADDLVLGEQDPDPDEVERVVRRIVIPALEAEVEAIRALDPPSGDEDQIEAILSATEAGIAEIEADPDGLADGEIPASFRRAQRLAEAYGSRECGLR